MNKNINNISLNQLKYLLNESTKTKVIAYHGGDDFLEFSYDFIGKGNNQLGSGFYFTTNYNEAKGYALDRKVPTIIKAELTFNGLIGVDEQLKYPRSKIASLIKASPVLDEALENWGDVSRKGYVNVLNYAISNYEVRNYRSLFAIGNDFFPDCDKEFNLALTKYLGIDGIFEKYFTEDDGEFFHYMVFNTNQIKILERIKI